MTHFHQTLVIIFPYDSSPFYLSNLHSTYDSSPFYLSNLHSTYNSSPFLYYQSPQSHSLMAVLSIFLLPITPETQLYSCALHSSITNLHFCLQTLTHYDSFAYKPPFLITNLHSCLLIFLNIVVSLVSAKPSVEYKRSPVS